MAVSFADYAREVDALFDSENILESPSLQMSLSLSQSKAVSTAQDVTVNVNFLPGDLDEKVGWAHILLSRSVRIDNGILGYSGIFDSVNMSWVNPETDDFYQVTLQDGDVVKAQKNLVQVSPKGLTHPDFEYAASRATDIYDVFLDYIKTLYMDEFNILARKIRLTSVANQGRGAPTVPNYFFDQ